jgi:5-methyltetrahydropteroyltriglutamate--homocysteine methyltransferase
MKAPPFRAEHIGSLLRPASLLDLRRRHAAGAVKDAELRAAEDAAIRDAVAMQERVGLRVVTDGEFRRHSYHSYFFAQLGDIRPDYVPGDNGGGIAMTPRRAPQPIARINGRVGWTKPIHVEDFKFLKSLTKQMPKITIPGPCALHFRGGDKAVLASAYKETQTFWADIVDAFRKELAALAEAGCAYVQMDETAFAKFGDPEVQASLAARGDHWSDLIDRYIEVTNEVLKGVTSPTVGMHLCRGNRAGQFHSEGGYDVVAERLFNKLDIDIFFLEYDSERAGDFSPLRHVPKDKHVVLGLVSTKTGDMETKDALKRKVEGATKYVDLERLSISPQCGFASVDLGNPLSAQAQEDKLRLVVETAKEIWGEA